MVEHARLRQLHGEVQARLPADGRQQRVGPLLRDDGRQHFDRQRLNIGRVGDLGVGHDRGRVRIDQHDAVTLVAQHLARLRARIVELGRLPDDNRAGADDENGMEVSATRHIGQRLFTNRMNSPNKSSESCGPGEDSG